MDKQENKKKKHGIAGAVRIIILTAAIAVFCYAGYQLYDIWHAYQAAGAEYDDLKNSYTSSYTPTPTPAPEPVSSTAEPAAESTAESSAEESGDLIEDAEPPLSVDFASLQGVNSDVVGWLYIDAIPSISYPVCRGTDNDYYLHHTFEKKTLFAGSIFMDYHNAADFTNPNTILYGHNMKNQSMFGLLKNMRQQSVYDSDPYFWVLTPKGNYRYHIFAAFETPVDSAAYELYSKGGADFLAWEKEMQNASEAANNVALSGNDKTVMLSTCTSDSSTRCIVLGKCVSTQRPE